MKIFIAVLILWNIFNTFVAITALLACKMNYDDIEVIKSWEPYRDIFKIKIPKNKRW